MAAISETLRQARLRSGVDLDKLAAKTKINPRYLQAIETGDFDKLPSGIFARMFIKQYAEAVGLDGASFADEFQRVPQFGGPPSPASGSAAQPRHRFHPNVPGMLSNDRRDSFNRAVSSLVWVLGAVLVCSGAYYGLAHFQARQAGMTAAPAAIRTAPQKTDTGSRGGVSGAPAGMSTAVQKDRASADPLRNAGQPVAAANTGQPSAPIQLGLNATEPVWVKAISDGKVVFSEILPAGSSKIITASEGVHLTLGNAGGIEITFNGRKLEPFGPAGQVRTVDFTPSGAQVVSRTPPPNPDPLC